MKTPTHDDPVLVILDYLGTPLWSGAIDKDELRAALIGGGPLAIPEAALGVESLDRGQYTIEPEVETEIELGEQVHIRLKQPFAAEPSPVAAQAQGLRILHAQEFIDALKKAGVIPANCVSVHLWARAGTARPVVTLHYECLGDDRLLQIAAANLAADPEPEGAHVSLPPIVE